MAEALYQVKSAMGNDAVILHTRTYFRRRWLGLRRIEVAGDGREVELQGLAPRGAAQASCGLGIAECVAKFVEPHANTGAQRVRRGIVRIRANAGIHERTGAAGSAAHHRR